MLKRVAIALVLVAVGGGAAAIAFSAFVVPHQATGTLNAAQSTTDALYICQPSGTTVSPQCPIDTAGADETIFAANEDLVPGQVVWQKIRVVNVDSDPWDILRMTRSWTEQADPSGQCNTLPEEVDFRNGNIQPGGSFGPAVTVLGNAPSLSLGTPEPVEGVYYQSLNDNHFVAVNGSESFRHIDESGTLTVHVQPGAFEDLLLGIRLPVATPDDCLDVVWEVTTTWEVQPHIQ